LTAALAAPFPFHAVWRRAGIRPFVDDFLYARNWLAKEELMTVEGKINEILPDGRLGVTPGNGYRINAYGR
jgi:hypothetical protein